MLAFAEKWSFEMTWFHIKCLSMADDNNCKNYLKHYLTEPNSSQFMYLLRTIQFEQFNYKCVSHLL